MKREIADSGSEQFRNPMDGGKLLECFSRCHRVCEEVSLYGIEDFLGMVRPTPASDQTAARDLSGQRGYVANIRSPDGGRPDGACGSFGDPNPTKSPMANALIRFITRAYRPPRPPAADLISHHFSLFLLHLPPPVMSTYDHSRVSRFIGRHPCLSVLLPLLIHPYRRKFPRRRPSWPCHRLGQSTWRSHRNHKSASLPGSR